MAVHLIAVIGICYVYSGEGGTVTYLATHLVLLLLCIVHNFRVDI